jgi:hypothetical protein
MRLPFCILNVLGDVLDDGELQFVEAARTLKAARRRIEALAKLSPGQYVIYNGQTGERMPIVAGAKLRPLVFGRFGKTPAEQSNALHS